MGTMGIQSNRESRFNSHPLSPFIQCVFMRRKTSCLLTAFALLTLISAAHAQSIYSPYAFTNFVGAPGGAGNADGTGNNARFRGVDGVATDTAGNIYVMDTLNSLVRKITPAGVVTTIAGGFSAGGTSGIAVDPSGNVYVASAATYTIEKITPAGVVSTFAGVAGSPGTADGPLGTARLTGPMGLAADAAGNIYMTDGYAVRSVSPAGVVSTLAGSVLVSGSADGTNDVARFGSTAGTPHGLAVDANQNIFVVDFGNSTIREVSPQGTNWVVTTIAGSAGMYGFTDDVGSAARFSYLGPNGIAIGPGDTLYVTDSGNTTIRQIVFNGTGWGVSTFAGATASPGTGNGTGTAAHFSFLKGIAIDGNGNLFASDFQNFTIRKITTPGAIVTTFAGLPPAVGTSDGTGSGALFYIPNRVAVDAAGNIYIADTSNHTIRRATPDGVVTTLAGKPGTAGSANGTNTVARFRHPNGLVVDNATNIYVADTGNDLIRKVSPVGTSWAVTTRAGLAQTTGTNNGIGSAARFSSPQGITMDGSGNLYVADSQNFAIRQLTFVSGTNWSVSTYAGLAGTPGFADGALTTTARFNSPHDITIDGAGNFYVSDGYRLREISGGLVSSIAGCIGCLDALEEVDGSGSGIRPGEPIGVAADSAGNLFFTDLNFHTVRRLSSSGVMTTLGGLSGQSSSVDGVGSTSRFNGAWGIAVDKSGNLYVADSQEDRIVKGVPAVAFDSGAVLSNNFLQTRLAAGAATNVVVQFSTNLTSWTSFLTNALWPTGLNLSLPVTGGQKFFRAHSQ